MKLSSLSLIPLVSAQDKVSLFSSRLWPGRCLWQCDKLFNRDFVQKDCSKGDVDLTSCVCDHILVRPKFPQCVVSICGNLDDNVIEAYLQDHVLFPKPYEVHASVGLWPACTQSPREIIFHNESRFWKPISSNEDLSSTLFTHAADHRVLMPHWMRRLLVPIWRPSGLESRLGYRPPPDAANVENPRSMADPLGKSIFSVYFFAIVAYAHLLHMTSESERHLVEFLQVVAFVLLPGLPTVQLVNNLLKVVFRSAWSAGFRYNASAICGQHVFERRTTLTYRARLVSLSTHELEGENQRYWTFKFWGRLLAILVNLVLVAARVAAYFRRLRTTLPGSGHSAMYIAAIGMDHRLGWVAFGGMVSTVVTLLRHAVNIKWSISPNLHLPRRSTFDLKMEVWLEVVAAAIGQSMLIKLTERITSYVLLSRLLESLGGRYTSAALAFVVLFCVQYRHPLWAGLRRRSSGVRTALLVAFVIIGATYIATVVFVQIFVDVEELADLRLGWVFGWNYLWRVPEPSWWFML